MKFRRNGTMNILRICHQTTSYQRFIRLSQYFKVHPVGQIKFIYRFTVRVSRQSLSSLIEQ